MPMLSDKDRTFLRDHLAKSLTSPVKLLFFTQSIACQFCQQTEQVLTELAELSDKVNMETYNFVTDKEVADAYGIDKLCPAPVVDG